jgi:hypothetical protein
VDVENKYYNAKQLKGDDPEAAIDEFLGVPALEDEKGDWYARAEARNGRQADHGPGDSRVSNRPSNSSSSSLDTTRLVGQMHLHYV